MALSTPPAIPAGTFAARPQPVLPAAGGLFLRPWAPCDAAVFFAAYADPEIRHWHTRQPASQEQVHEWFDQYRQAWARETGASWAVTRSDGEVLGRIAMGGLNLDDGVAGCAYWVLPAARGAGVASRALTGLSAWALGEGSDAVHSDGRHDMHLHARIRGDEQLA
ncbi:Acetyltransferase (GNAT) domain-containing protein [Micromonospora haikouensis]|uniref:Acetyltransferase (GNAT) domain-containing protein n=1 Tax=Micromonospora haikouensis TaxID=686309 RepID=A0A1C4WUR3_9ACTN|nr:GNAT family N-acetyltransferase [Micromonospora haikouensis]SCE99919.1 Acetyltransferase (GNAT) domain-containing protein [Micromonospora haikouensis]